MKEKVDIRVHDYVYWRNPNASHGNALWLVQGVRGENNEWVDLHSGRGWGGTAPANEVVLLHRPDSKYLPK